MLTYEMLSRVVAQERASKTLASLPEEFFEDAKVYIESKSRLSEAKGDAWEVENARRMLEDLLEMRERKILTLALYFVRSGVSPNNITAEEQDFFSKTVSALKEFQATKKLLLDGKPESRWLLALLDDVPEFLDLRLRKHGPYKKGDVATIPEEHARLLVEKGMARKMEI